MASRTHPVTGRPVPGAPRSAKPAARLFHRRYVWQWPIRVFHWLNALCIAGLFTTGLYIAFPWAHSPAEAWQMFLMGRFRQVHFILGYVFAVNYLWRCAWFFMGNRYARSGFPYVWRPAWWKDLFVQAGEYLALRRGVIHLGHNALGGVTYTVFAIGIGLFQIVTGFALFSESRPGGPLNSAFGWVFPLFGGSHQVHMWHHLASWAFLFFAILHIYIVFYDGLQFRNGLITSIFSGEKFYREGEVDPECLGDDQ
jgi:Ni/Fe-hydrogenase 1 B-type cytochrome subunit